MFPMSQVMKYNTIVTDVAKKLGVGFLYGTYSPEKDFELILTVKMETRLPVCDHVIVNFRRSIITV